MPGVVISTAVRTGPTGTTVRESSQAFFVGMAERGPHDVATRIRSMEEFEAAYGGYQSYSYLYDTVDVFFEEGGTQCYVARVVGPNATEGSETLVNDDGDNAITLTANGPGAWSANVEVEVVAGIAAGSRRLKLYYGGTQVFDTDDCTTVEQMAGRVNSSSLANRYVSATVVTASVLPSVTSAPIPTLSAGDDDRANATDTEHETALALFSDALGTGVVANADSTSSTVRDGLIAHANTYNRIAFVCAPLATTVADAATAGRTVAANTASAEHGAMYFPWVHRPTSIPGVNRAIPPLGYAAGARARAHNQVGAAQPGAGIVSNARFINGVEYDLDKAAGDALDAAHVNAIRTINNTIRIYGARSLSADTANFRYYTGQDIVNHVVVEANRSLEDLLFSVIDGRNNIFASVEAKLIAILEPLRVSGALYEAFDENGKRIDYGYTVKCDASLNPTTQLADGLIKAKVGMRVSSVGDKIEVDIVKSNLTASVV